MTFSFADWVGTVLPSLAEQAWAKDISSRFVAVTGHFADVCAKAPRCLVGADESICFAPQRVARFRADDRRVIGLGVGVVILEDGPQGSHRTLKAPMYDRRGRIAGTVGIAVPVDDRCEARLAELRELVHCGPPAAPEWLERVRSILQHRYTHTPRLDSIARAVGRNADYITRAFHRQYGVTPVEYVHRLRCERVAHACVTTRSRLPELALAAGFSDQSHMTRVFTQYFGLPPARYRRTFRMTGDVEHEFAAVRTA